MVSVAEKIREIAKLPYVCDNCLGRQFGQLLTGLTNKERGEAVRKIISMMVDAGEVDSPQAMQTRKGKDGKEGKCWVCGGLFQGGIARIAKNILRKVRSLEFDTFLVGVRLSSELLYSEEKLWESVGIEHTEPIKEELSREIGKEFSRLSGKEFSRSPDVEILVDFGENRIEAKPLPVFIFGIYRKIKPGIPQTRWPSGKYRNSVEQIIGRVFKKAFKSKDYKLHGAGREDIDATCSGGRPFVMELIEPRIRKAELKELEKALSSNPWVRVSHLRHSSIREVREIKEAKYDKEYVATVRVQEGITAAELKKLKRLEGKSIKQRTPLRVAHRRADKVRRRKILKISAKKISDSEFLLRVRTESGTYIKELVSGDRGRTKPSVSSVLGKKCEVVSLDVSKVYWRAESKRN